MRLLESKISRKYFLISFVVIFVTLSSVYVFTSRVMIDSFHEQIRYRDRLISKSLGKRIDFILQTMINDTRALSVPSLHRTRSGNPQYQEEVQKVLARQPLYLFVAAVAADGALLSRIPEPRDHESFALDPIIERMRWSRTHVISDLIRLPDGKKTFVVAHPVLDEKGEFVSSVLVFVNLNVLSEFLAEAKIGREGTVALLDRQGAIVAHSATQRIGGSLAAHELGRLLQLERSGMWEGRVFEKPMLVAYQPTLLGAFGLLVGESSSQAWTPSRQVLLVLLQGFLFVLVVATGITVLGTARIVKPIIALIRQSNEYKNKQRESFERITTGDEIELLSITMDQMAQKLTERERRLFYVLESIPYGVVTVNRQGEITTFNRGAEQLTGFSRSDVMGRSIFEIPLKEHKDELLSLKTLQDGESFDEADTYILDKTGHRHDVKMHSALYEGKDKRLQGAIIVFRDVGDVRKLEEYLRRSEQLSSLGQLTAGIAHEVKNPLSIIQAAAEGILLELDEQTDKALVKTFAEDILSTSDRMNVLLKDFLSLALAPETRGFDPVNLVAVIAELLHLLKKKFHDQHIHLAFVCTVENACVLGHKASLTQVFLNILLNSIQSMKAGGRLQVEVAPRGSDWQVKVSDNGCGIPSEKLQRIFNPFFSTKSDGTGLGLAIAHEIVTEHQGTIWARSTVGQGTDLYVEIPGIDEDC